MPGLPENIKLPSKVLDKLKTLDHELQEEDITIKGYCKRKWALLEKYLTKDISTNVTKIQNAIAQKNMDEKEGYLKIQDILQIKNIAISEKQTSQKKQILKSTENIPKPSCSYQSDDTQKLLKSKPLPQKLVPCNINKRINNNIENISNKKMKNTAEISKPNNVHISIPQINLKPKRCFTCKQDLRTIKFYNGHPNNAVDEFIALTDPKLMLFTGEENEIHSFDERPHNKITNFNIYDKDGHLCPFDSGLIEKNILLYFSGYIKPIYDENPSCDNGIPAKDLGPINEWWISGFDGGEKALIGFSTEYCEYYLMQPHKNYQPLMKSIEEKMYISKIIIEFLLNNSYLNPSYEDLLNYLQNTSLPEYISQITEETLLKHAQFICDQVNSYDSTADEDEILLITIACMRALVKLAGVTFVERQDVRQFEREEKTTVKIKKKRKAEYYVFTKATTTSLVREVFETYFPEQIDKNKEGVAVKTGCGFCATCHLPDCGKCTNCRKRKRLGSKGPNKETCKNRRCPNIAIQAASDSENDDFEFEPSPFYQQPLRSKKLLHSVTWGTPPVAQHSNKTYYNSASIGDKINIKSGDFVFLNTENSNSPSLIAKVVNMYEDNSGNKMFHANLFCRGVDTILGETTDPKEIFLLNECDVCPLGTIVSKTEVEYLKPDPNWRFNTGKLITSNNKTYFYQKQYDKKFARFENIVEEEVLTVLNYNLCAICQKNLKQKQLNTPIIKDNVIYWKNEYYKTGTAVFLHPNTFKFKTIINSPKSPEPNIVDEDIYPEFYRKKSEKTENNEYCEPFCVGYIQNILENADEIQIKVQKLYRPENTHKGIILSQQLDLNIIFWSDEQEIVSFEKVIGKCYIAFADILDIPVDEWSKQGPNRFYFTQKYDINTQEFSPVGENASFIGKSRKNKSSTKSKNKNTNLVEEPNVWLKLEQPLRTMDVFAGCGGLSEGLHQSGVADTKWAIEKEKPAANAFKLNNPNAIVYIQDCNHLLNLAISGKSQTEDSKTIPRPGDVELLVGGPPCQGFSGMNRFNAGQYSLFKNSLIVSFLSYCDFYRPKYFILENVRNFAVFKKGIILKLTLRCLLAMGYQCTFGILQAGNYGVPQIRRRLIILAAAPGETLPKYPEPIHIMDKKGRATQLDIVLDNCRYSTELKWLPLGAPYRTITVRDAMSDLPSIPNGYQTNETSYDSEPLSHFQRLMRGLDDLILRDHICKEMASIVEARMAYIPLASGSDWRDLPNIVIKLSDGTYTNKLIYEYDDKKNGKNSKGGLRGVCPCAEKKVCDPSERQFNTLIPWCLPHTANRHNQWAGLYGRLEWDGVFATTVTNPEPMGHQGRVLHPVQHRVVSVRECARSQGFPDKYRFYGNILDKYKQIGNAVPPPMGAAIGREILNAILINKH